MNDYNQKKMVSKNGKLKKGQRNSSWISPLKKHQKRLDQNESKSWFICFVNKREPCFYTKGFILFFGRYHVNDRTVELLADSTVWKRGRATMKRD